RLASARASALRVRAAATLSVGLCASASSISASSCGSPYAFHQSAFGQASVLVAVPDRACCDESELALRDWACGARPLVLAQPQIHAQAQAMATRVIGTVIGLP